MVQLHGINDLTRRHENVDDPEVFGETMPNKAAPKVREHAQLLVGCLVRYKRALRPFRIEIVWLDAGKLRQVIDDGLRRPDMVINEWLALARTFATQHGDAR